MGTYEGVPQCVPIQRAEYDQQSATQHPLVAGPLTLRLFLHGLGARLVLHPRVIVDVSVALAMFIALLVAAGLSESRYDAIVRATDNAQNVATLVEHDVSQTIGFLDLSLQAVVDGAQDPRVMAMDEPYRSQMLFDRSASAGLYLGVLRLVSASGDVEVDSVGPQKQTENIADTPWFIAQRDRGDVGMYMSAPYQSRLHPGEWSIAFSRRVNHSDGSFAGVAVISINLTYFKDLLATLKLGPNSEISVIQDDGTIIMRIPGANFVGRHLSDESNFARYKAHLEPSFFGTATLDGAQRLYITQRFKTYPLYVSVGLGKDQVLSAWVHRAWYAGIITALLMSTLVGTALLLAQQFKHRLVIEDELRLLSRTDGLTGLNNRRTIDEILSREWKRSQRSQQPISFLFIDIDRFKDFNDTYGHQQGDNALFAVAKAVAGSVRRPGDTPGRFGGEEFVVVLPETDPLGAAIVAATIHNAVKSLNIAHAASEYGILTVSIGVACSADASIVDQAELICRADAALYEAKKLGRDQTFVAIPLQIKVAAHGHETETPYQ